MTLTKRIIPCLDVKNGRVVKGFQFESIKDAGNPVELAKQYSKEGADELVFLDITASEEKRETIKTLVRKVASVINIPFTVGGGVNSMDDARNILLNGADKVGINTGAIKNPKILTELMEIFGRQCVVVAIDTKRNYEPKENANLFVVQLAALLHDIADSKFYKGDETLGPKIASEFLKEHNVDQLSREHIIKIIENVSFKNSLSNTGKSFNSIELQIVQDADRLDAIGAIGIARAFNYGGFKNRELYNPEITPNLTMSKEEYKKSSAPTINHFYEKLLLLKEKMNTSTGKKLAEKRHDFMLSYLDQFYQEWEGLK